MIEKTPCPAPAPAPAPVSSPSHSTRAASNPSSPSPSPAASSSPPQPPPPSPPTPASSAPSPYPPPLPLPSPSHSSASCSAPPSPRPFSFPPSSAPAPPPPHSSLSPSTLSPSAAASSPPHVATSSSTPTLPLPPRPPPHALQLFDEMPRRTTVTFNALLSRLARYSDAGRAHGLLLFSRMLSSGPTPNADTLAAALLCCAGLGALALGRAAHALAARRGAARAPQLGTSLVHMYAKCGSLDSARRVFDRAMPARDASTWTAMIAALAAHARGEDAVHLFDEMVGRENLSPDSLTFTCALHACANSGMAERGLKLFDEMQSVYGIKPRMEHYGAIVDLLGRAGRIDAAECVVSSMPFEPNRAVWGAFLHACVHNADSALAEKLGKRISELGLGLGFDVGVSNLYARVGRWEEVGEVRDRMVELGVQKEKGFSSVEVNGEVVKFLVGDVRHPLTLEIYDLLERIGAVIMVFDG
ncbi:Pentatricopeptide repeat-containing protein, chloroplastic/mitochondrial [Ananas comosus]|uniref:Pentatricopeptide repeat-containing protein, chloroplastic/mitochondrial n=1 Tax=Ananas comosus TaxID=4615 RepID=A0A199W896_ANACO|nr:Pentatricopeptide repeat-containing protein, chloroplastic/mitochondrial [Ananas comosus]